MNALSGLQGDDRFAQIDVPIQPGNSGGPLLTTGGEVAGIVTSMLHPLATLQLAGALPQNVNYAIKKSYILALLDSYPKIRADMHCATTKRKLSFEDAVAKVRKSTVLVLVY